MRKFAFAVSFLAFVIVAGCDTLNYQYTMCDAGQTGSDAGTQSDAETNTSAELTGSVDVPLDTITDTTADIVMTTSKLVNYTLEVVGPVYDQGFELIEGDNAVLGVPGDYFGTWILPESGLKPNTGYLILFWFEDADGNKGSSHTSFTTKPTADPTLFVRIANDTPPAQTVLPNATGVQVLKFSAQAINNDAPIGSFVFTHKGTGAIDDITDVELWGGSGMSFGGAVLNPQTGTARFDSVHFAVPSGIAVTWVLRVNFNTPQMGGQHAFELTEIILEDGGTVYGLPLQGNTFTIAL